MWSVFLEDDKGRPSTQFLVEILKTKRENHNPALAGLENFITSATFRFKMKKL